MLPDVKPILAAVAGATEIGSTAVDERAEVTTRVLPPGCGRTRSTAPRSGR
jgi:hypothetical protein